MTPAEPGYYWATRHTGRVIREVVWDDDGDESYLAVVDECGCLEPLDLYSDWSERLIDPKEERALQTQKFRETIRCKKCGKLGSENTMKYCGDGSDKDNGHVWVKERNASK